MLLKHKKRTPLPDLSFLTCARRAPTLSFQSHKFRKFPAPWIKFSHFSRYRNGGSTRSGTQWLGSAWEGLRDVHVKIIIHRGGESEKMKS